MEETKNDTKILAMCFVECSLTFFCGGVASEREQITRRDKFCSYSIYTGRAMRKSVYSRRSFEDLHSPERSNLFTQPPNNHLILLILLRGHSNWFPFRQFIYEVFALYLGRAEVLCGLSQSTNKKVVNKIVNLHVLQTPMTLIKLKTPQRGSSNWRNPFVFSCRRVTLVRSRNFSLFLMPF